MGAGGWSDPDSRPVFFDKVELILVKTPVQTNGDDLIEASWLGIG
jgi:hypothetical protein